jgi:7-cyano-7-deazaguanine synthase
MLPSDHMESGRERPATAVLISAGLDSAVLAAAEARRGHVFPVYVSTGLAWEAEERRALERLLTTHPYASLEPVAVLDFTARDLYPASHWALRGEVPGFDTPDEDVYLIGRNVMLLSKAAVFCAHHQIGRIAIGPLAANPFPDATSEFFAAMARALSLGLDQTLVIDAPFVRMDKRAVIALGVELGVPLALTLSCMNPRDGVHCGQCNKCRERRDGFHDAGIDDDTAYATASVR